MKQERLLEMTILLINKGKSTAKELASHFEVSTRTIYRDLDTLSLAGVPVYTVKGKDGGIHLMENFTLDRSVMSKEEQDELLFSLQSLKATAYLDVSGTLDKLSSLFQNKEINDWIEVDLSQWGDGEREREIFENLKKAIVYKLVVDMEYMNSSGEKLWRKVEPLKLFYKGNNWYLDGFCRNKQDFRRFRLSRVRQLKLTDDQFERKPVPEFSNDFNSYYNEKYIELHLSIDRKAEHRVFEEFEEENITIMEDGNFRIRTVVPVNEWMYGYLLSFGEFLEVVEPIQVREVLVKRLQATLQKYKGNTP